MVVRALGIARLIRVVYGSPVTHTGGTASPALVTISEAAALLGVSVQTLRRWDQSGKFPARRHPLNSYRLYARDEVVLLCKRIADGGRAA